jgi:hypothetical protein
MTEFTSLERNGDDGHHVELGPEALKLHNRVLQTQRDQSADEARIDDAIMRAEKEIARLEQRRLAPDQLVKETIAIRDRAILIIRDVRKNMQRRALVAKRMQDSLSDDLRRSSRFAISDSEDTNLRKHFIGLLDHTATSALTHHLLHALEAGNTACAELIRFEFQCRDDRHEFMSHFEAVVAKFSPNDPVEMRKRLANVGKAIENIDGRVTNLLQLIQLVRTPQEIDAVA